MPEQREEIAPVQALRIPIPIVAVALVAFAAMLFGGLGRAGAQSTPSDFHPPDTRTDNEVLDAIIEAIVNGDSEALAGLVEFLEFECSTEPGGGPACPDGVADGTAVQVFPFAACQPEYLFSEADVLEAFAGLLDGTTFYLYAVYSDPPSPAGDAAAYRILFGTLDEEGVAIDVSAAGAIVASVQCGPPVNMIVSGADFVLAPIGTQEPAPTETPVTPTEEPTSEPTATPTNQPATPTPVAPNPPDTGSGSGNTGGDNDMIWVAVAIVAAVAAGGAGAMAFRPRS
jgi:hypothetical protein